MATPTQQRLRKIFNKRLEKEGEMQKEEMKSGHFVPELSALVPSASCTWWAWPAISKNSKLNVEVLATASSIKLVGDAWELHAPTYVFFSWAPVIP